MTGYTEVEPHLQEVLATLPRSPRDGIEYAGGLEINRAGGHDKNGAD
jgi:hypothetical protein